MDGLKPILQDFLRRGLVISPWLAGVGQNGRLNDQTFVYLDQQCKEFASLQWTDEAIMEIYDTIPIPLRLPDTVVYEITASTAVFLAHQETGKPILQKKFARRAFDMVKQFCADYQFSSLVRLYTLATGYENMQALAYYERIPETPFSLGHWHRPWVDYSLSDEVILGVLLKHYKIEKVDGKRYVSLTNKGWATYRQVEAFLDDAGYLTHRIRQLHITRFNLFKDFETIVKKFAPEWIPQRRDFLDWVGILPGMHVLELGCADGLFTFDGGLAERIGPSGRLVALDPSRGMLSKARRKSARRQTDWVEFVQGQAEVLPFENETFDAVVGVSFLHFTDKSTALSEMARVTKSGGVVASFHPLPFGFDAPFFRDWFRSLLDIAQRSGRQEPKNYLSSAEDMITHFGKARLLDVSSIEITSKMLFWDPEQNVNALISGVGWSQEELATIPWKAREDLIVELKERGKHISAVYTPEERTLLLPNQMLKGIKV